MLVRRSSLPLVAAALLSLLACASDDAIPVSTNYDPLVRFPAQASYVWDEAANSLPDDPAIDRLSLLLVEDASGRRVWLGFGRAEIHVGLSLEERRARLSDAMARMLEKYRPRNAPRSEPGAP